MKKYFQYIKKGIIAGAALCAAAATGLVALQGSGGNALTIYRNCDATAIIYCGSTTVSELQSDYATKDDGRYSDIPTVFSHFGISAADIQNMGSTYKWGQVHKDGTVWVDGVQIGSGAVTAGRVYKPGSTQIPGTSAYVRSTQIAFASDAIQAFIGYENGVPAWAILAGCGNPVMWNKPAVSIEKTVRNAANTGWVESDTFANGSTLTYRLLVTNSGKAADKNVIVKDTLPAYNTFVADSVKVNGVAKSAAGNVLTTTGLNIGTVNAGQTVEITFQAKVSVPATKCGETPFTNKAVVDGELTTPDEDTAGGKTTVNCAVYKCESLTASKTAIKLGETVTFTAKASAQYATIQSYKFTVNGQVVQNTSSATHSFKPTAVGNYDIKVTIVTDKGEATAPACAASLTVTQEVAYKCDQLTASKYGIKVGETTTLTAKGSVVNATIQSYEFKVNGNVVQNTASNTYQFSADKVGTYNISVTVITDKGSNTNANCAVKIEVAEVPVCPYNPALPPEHPDCKPPVEKCPIPGKEHLPKDSPDCKEAPKVLPAVTELPNTGAGGVAAIFTVVTVAGAFLHNALSRKSLR